MKKGYRGRREKKKKEKKPTLLYSIKTWENTLGDLFNTLEGFLFHIREKKKKNSTRLVIYTHKTHQSL